MHYKSCVILVFCIFLLVSDAADKTTTGTEVKHFLRDMLNDAQLLRVEGFAESEPHLKEAWHKLLDEVVSLPEGVKSYVKQIGQKAKEAFVARFTANEEQFVHRLDFTAKTITEALNSAQEEIHRLKEATKAKIVQFESLHVSDVKDSVKQEWKEIKDKLHDQLEKVTEKMNWDLIQSKQKWDKFFQRMEHHAKHSPHHPILRCAHCGRPYTLQEFLKLFDREGSYLIQIEDWWTDVEVEEFFEGWAEWANRYAIHCVDCGSPKWSNVEYVTEEEEKKIEAEHHVRDEL